MKKLLTASLILFAYIFIACSDVAPVTNTSTDNKPSLTVQTGIYLIWHDAEGWQNNTFYSNDIKYSNDTLFIKYDPVNITILNTGGDYRITYWQLIIK